MLTHESPLPLWERDRERGSLVSETNAFLSVKPFEV